MAARLLPLELIDKCIGSRLWIIMKGDKVSQQQESAAKPNRSSAAAELSHHLGQNKAQACLAGVRTAVRSMHIAKNGIQQSQSVGRC